MTEIHWPVEHAVAGADIHVVNCAVSTASPEQVWAWIVRPDRWSEIYPSAHRVRHLAGPWPEVSLGSRFSWITLAAPVTTTVNEYEPYERLAWSGTGPGARGHHAWLLLRSPGGGCEIITEETQRGLLVRILRPVAAARDATHAPALGRCSGRHRAPARARSKLKPESLTRVWSAPGEASSIQWVPFLRRQGTVRQRQSSFALCKTAGMTRRRQSDR